MIVIFPLDNPQLFGILWPSVKGRFTAEAEILKIIERPLYEWIITWGRIKS